MRSGADGSSPLTRGKPVETLGLGPVCGLIPAHAGKTTPHSHDPRAPGAHPRSRGENFACGAAIAKNVGSSPLTRGKPPRSSSTSSATRLIPAHAGKTTPACESANGSTAHPRSRGENEEAASADGLEAGSSPLTRGKLHPKTGKPLDDGLIPAHAGKTSTYSHTRAHPRAHPRSRGENPGVSSGRWTPAGSSPLTRGKHRRQAQRPGRAGLIPAHAGKTVCEGDDVLVRGAHPRSRGENSITWAAAAVS